MEALIQFLILGLPEDGTRLHLRPIDIFTAETNKGQTAAGRLESMDEPPLLTLGGLTLVKHHPITRLQRTLETHRHAVRGHIDDGTEISTTLLPEAGMD